jgi:hypothetical protein
VGFLVRNDRLSRTSALNRNGSRIFYFQKPYTFKNNIDTTKIERGFYETVIIFNGFLFVGYWKNASAIHILIFNKPPVDRHHSISSTGINDRVYQQVVWNELEQDE